MQLVGLLLLAGLPLFWLFVWTSTGRVVPGAGAGVSRDDGAWSQMLGRLRRSSGAGALLVAASLAGELARILGPVLSGLPVGSQLSFAFSFLIGVDTGRVLALRLPALLGTWLVLRRALSAPGDDPSAFRWARGAACAWVAVLLLTISLSGHAAGSAFPFLTIAADWLHLLAATLWGGALLGFSLLPWSVLESRPAAFGPQTVAAVRRLSVLGLAAVLALVGTGFIMAGVYIFNAVAAAVTFYGRSVFLKVSAVALLIGLAWLNRYRVVPALEKALQPSSGVAHPPAANSAAARLARLRRCIRAETAVLLAVLGLTASLSVSPPPTAPGELAGAREWEYESSSWTVQVRLAPQGKGGRVSFHIEVRDRESREPVELERVVVAVDMPGHSMAVAPSVAVREGPGVYAATTHVFMAGRWEAEIRLDGADRSETAVVSFAVVEGPLTERSPLQIVLIGSPRGAVNIVGAVLAAAVGVWLAASWAPAQGREGSWTGVLSGLGFLAAGVLWIVMVTSVPTAYWQDAQPQAKLEPAALERARELYEAHCLICHGVAGRGDGPGAEGMRPRPADFAVHVGHHTEGEFFWYITNGKRSTGMPAFGEVLPEEERWLLARYVRELGLEARKRP